MNRIPYAPTVLEVRGLGKSFGAIAAVKNASFRVEKGERFGLLGPNGAGKTTTISMITGTLDADQGSVLIDGEAVSTRSNNTKRKVGYVPQELALYDEITARDNLRFFGSLYGLGLVQVLKSSQRSLEIAGLTDRADEPVKNFSGGMKRRLNIAVALMHDPELMIFDEPTVGVDPQSRNAIFETLLRLADEGKTIVYTTHYMEEVERLCTRVAVMDHGEVVAQGRLGELQSMLGHGNRVVIEMESATFVQGIPGALNLKIEEQTLTFDVEDMTHDLPKALAALSEAGVRFTGVRAKAASLEEVFLHLTGKSLRD